MKPFFNESDCDTWAKDGEPRISLRKANRLIQERRHIVYGWIDGDGFRDFSQLKTLESYRGGATHQALLICVEEIEKDSAEKILKELIDCSLWEGPIKKLKDRAKRLLGGEK